MPAMLLLGRHGYTEEVLRRRSLEWLQEAIDTIEKREAAELASSLAVMTLAAKSPYSAEANDSISDLYDELTGSADITDAWLLNPNATTDLEALRASGKAVRVHVSEEASNGTEPTG